MLQKKFFLNNGTSNLNYLKELNTLLYYKSYMRCDLLDSVFVLDDGCSLSHIKLSKFSKKAVGSSFLSSRVTYRHKNVLSFRVTSFLSYHVLSAKNAATLIVNKLKLLTYRDKNFGFKLFFVLCAVKCGFRCFSMGFQGFMPSRHYKPAMRRFILETLRQKSSLHIFFFFKKGFLSIFLGQKHDSEVPTSDSKYAFYSSYSFFRLAFLMSTSSMACTRPRRVKKFSRCKLRRVSRLNLNSVFLNHDLAYIRLEKKIRLCESFFSHSFSELREESCRVHEDLILRQTKYKKIKGLIYQDKNILSNFSVMDYSSATNEKKLEAIISNILDFSAVYQVIKKDFEKLKKKIVALPPETVFTERSGRLIAKIRTSFFDDLLVERKATYLRYRLTEKIRQRINRCNEIVSFILDAFSFNFLKEMLKIKYKKRMPEIFYQKRRKNKKANVKKR